MFRLPSGHLQVFILCMLKEPAACYFRLFGVAPCIASLHGITVFFLISFLRCSSTKHAYCKWLDNNGCVCLHIFVWEYIILHLFNSSSLWRKPSSGMLRCVALVRTDDSEDCSTSIIRVTRILLHWFLMEALHSSETSVLTRAILRNIPVDGILHSHRCENVKSSILFFNPKIILPCLIHQSKCMQTYDCP
jgi:hypothetical protein